ncbi:QWRF motif-containing protein 2 [Vitis vinifera]|uniref:QWRF motif-containing protein 2 n=1 Tax=Vitis vinifera TaxID=29760 RepID=A0A438H6A2_VITVI|nr:QWRF motif-containing protein 2 [Vitis vinifera]
MMVAAISEAASTNRPNPKASSHTHDTHLRNPARPPLLPLRRTMASFLNDPNRDSRSTNSTASSTPLPVAASSTSSSFPRSHSVDRRRPATAAPGSAGEVSAASRLLFTSTRSLSVSFQGEAFSLPISKAKAAPNLGNVRKGTPERRKPTPVRGSGAVDQVENSRPWPGRSRSVNVLARSFDCSVDRKKSIGSGIVVGSFQQSMIDESRRASFDGRLSLDLGNAELLKVTKQDPDGNSANDSSVPTDLTASDTDSVSSGSTSGLQECAGVSGSRITFVNKPWFQNGSGCQIHTIKKFPSDNPLASPRTMMSPIRGATRPASPSKLMASSMPVSSPIRASSPARGKMGENRIVDAHLLRLLYNRHLQWRFVNARADAALLVQRMRAEARKENILIVPKQAHQDLDDAFAPTFTMGWPSSIHRILSIEQIKWSDVKVCSSY